MNVSLSKHDLWVRNLIYRAIKNKNINLETSTNQIYAFFPKLKTPSIDSVFFGMIIKCTNNQIVILNLKDLSKSEIDMFCNGDFDRAIKIETISQTMKNHLKILTQKDIQMACLVKPDEKQNIIAILNK